MSARLQNVSDHPYFAPIGAPPEFNMVVKDMQGTVLRQRQVPETNVALGLRGTVLAPRQSVKVEWAWDLTDQHGQSVPPGRYCVTATFDRQGVLNAGPSLSGLTSLPYCFWVSSSS